MEPFKRCKGLVAPMDRDDVDTDLIIPKQFLTSIERSGYGDFLFDSLRYLDEGRLGQDCSIRPRNPDFEFNEPRYAGAGILLSRRNFGCGSSREHAAWALRDYGFRCVVASSFADIFFSNCCRVGIVPVALEEAQVQRLFDELRASEGYELEVDLEACEVRLPDGERLRFELEDAKRYCLLNGLDAIGLSLESETRIRDFEQARRQTRPWLFENRAQD